MAPFPREDYHPLRPFSSGGSPVGLDLSDNTNLWGAHPAALEIIRMAPPEALTRYPSVYASELKDAIASRFGVSRENVATGCGSEDLLDSTLRASTVPPGRVSFPALEDDSGWADRIREETIENRKRLAKELRARGLHPIPSSANFLLVPLEPAKAVEVNRALQDRGVTCRAFSRLPDLGDALRITIGPWDLMERFLGALDQLFESGSGRP